MSDDGFKSDETSTGGTKVSPKDFWKLVEQERSSSDHPADPPEPAAAVELPAGSLEERLSAAQSQGLGPNLRRQLAFVGADEPVFEFQALGVKRYPSDSFDRSRAWHARGPDEAVALCMEADRWHAHGIYILPARLKSGVESRHGPPGKFYDIPKGAGTKDSDVEARLILAVDFDVKRVSGISATDEEVQRSVRVAQSAWSFLAHHLGESSLAYLHSGNGRQIHIALDALPETEQVKNTCAGLLTGLARLFNTPEVAVDEKLFDAKRILPACGTVKKKGAPDFAERPHRRTAILTPEHPTRVSFDKLRELANFVWEALDTEGRTAVEKSLGLKPQVTSGVTPIRSNPGAPYDLANAVDPQAVAEWLGLYNPSGEVVCPGCGETSGVAVLSRGLHCHHNRCKGKGRNGFRSNIDLVAEVQRLEPSEAVLAISDRFGLGLHLRVQPHAAPPPRESPPLAQSTTTPTAPTQELTPADYLQPLGDRLKASVTRAVRRTTGAEKPVPLPWEELRDHFGGGLWPGLHILCSGTGIGKTAAVLQVAKHSAESGVPVAYVGLEMDDLQFDLRLVGEEAKLRWSEMYTGRTDLVALTHAANVALEMVKKELPLHPINRNPMSWPATKMIALADAMRQKYPEPPLSEDGLSGGTGSRPILIILDYLQIVGPEEGDDGKYKSLDLRERIGRAAYAMREVATNYNIAVLAVASVARDKYGLWPMMMNAELQWDMDEHRLVNRRIGIPDVLVGLGKESGEIEYGADSVSILARVPDTYVDGQGESVVFATAKGRATGGRWTPMHFTGFRYEPSRDGGNSVLEALGKAERVKEQKKVQKEEEKKQAEDASAQKRAVASDAKEQQRTRDREACLRIVTQSPGIGSRLLRSRMAAELGECGRERAEAAVSYCENVSHTITVDRTNSRDLKHYPSGRSAPPGDGEVCVMDGQKNPPYPPVGAPHAPHGVGGVENAPATPATPATRGKNKRERVAEPPATPQKPPATPATPAFDSELDAAELLDAGSDLDSWNKRADERGWTESRRILATMAAKRMQFDAGELRQAAADGEDPRAWATEQGWDDARIRAAMRAMGDVASDSEGDERAPDSDPE